MLLFSNPSRASLDQCYAHYVAGPARKRATYDDLIAVPDHLVAELINGALRTQPRPRLRHARAASRLGQALGSPFDRGRGGPGGWILLDAPEVHLGKDVLVPDIAGWRRERMPELPDEAYTTLAPDWICEVLSPSTAALDRTEKMPIYARTGVSHIWLVDPRPPTCRWCIPASSRVGCRPGTSGTRPEATAAPSLGASSSFASNLRPAIPSSTSQFSGSTRSATRRAMT